jgi:hypothetical protein
MRKILVFISIFVAISAHVASAQEPPTRKELKRADLTGTSMEVVVSIIEYKPGDTIVRHSHHGEETFYVLEGGDMELPDGKKGQFVIGAAGINMRDVLHGGAKIVGDKTVKLLTVHIVDKGKPLYEPAK